MANRGLPNPPEMFRGWVCVTLASNMGAYNPASHHNASVGQHDTTAIQAGLPRDGFAAEVEQISTALLETAEYSNGCELGNRPVAGGAAPSVEF